MHELRIVCGLYCSVQDASDDQTKDEDSGTGTILLITLDRFALKSFNASFGLIQDKNLSECCISLSVQVI